MFRKLLAVLTLFLVMANLNRSVQAETLDIVTQAQSLGYDISAENRPASYILVDASSGEILWGDNIDLKRDPASMTKLMTVYLIYEAMAASQTEETKTIEATETDQKISKLYEISNNDIKAGVAYPIGDLLTAALVKSSNAAVYMLVKQFYPISDSAFLDLMNAKAKEFGMTNTIFYNQAGAIARAYDGHYTPERYLMQVNQTSAKDLAILAQRLMVDYPQVIDHTKNYTVKIMEGTTYEEEFQSYNESLSGGKFEFEGVNGLKTGSSPSAQFNMVATAQRDEGDLIAVVMGVGDWYDENSDKYRHTFVNTLMDYGVKVLKGQEQVVDQTLGSLPKTSDQVQESTKFSSVLLKQETGIARYRYWLLGVSLVGVLLFFYAISRFAD